MDEDEIIGRKGQGFEMKNSGEKKRDRTFRLKVLKVPTKGE